MHIEFKIVYVEDSVIESIDNPKPNAKVPHFFGVASFQLKKNHAHVVVINLA
jgi:hypothetical protein